MKKIYLGILFSCMIHLVSAQMNVGINTSSWGGVSNTTWNPAISDSKYAVDISLGAINSGFIQNYKGLNNTAFYQNTNSNIFAFNLDILNQNIFTNASFAKSYNSASKPVYLNQFSQIEGPGSFLLPFGNNKNAIAVSYHLNVAKSVSGMDQQLGFFADGNPSVSGTGTQKSFSAANAAWFDYDITYGRTIIDKGAHFFKMGVTLKILQELEASSMQATGLDYNVSSSSLDVTSGSLSSSHSQTPKFSAAGDIGFVYEFRPQKDKYAYDIDTFHHILPRYKNIYTLAVGFSVIDMGVLPNSSPQSGTVTAPSTLSPTNFDIFSKAPLNNWIGTPGQYTGAKTIGLPTRFNLYVDYNTKPGLGVNLSTTISPVFKSSNPQIAYGSSITLTGRFDLPLLGVYLPLTYNFNGNPGVGFALRGGPVWLGLSDFIGLAKSGGMNNCVVYAAVKVPIIFHKKSDKDGDKVSDKYDKCQFEMGTWATQGCADRDQDGVRDSVDQCPDQAGPAYLHGCPDTDGDSIPDKDDACPTAKGPRATHGCPDTDGDGIIDKDDECPYDPGPIEFKGCPDRDGDGVPDKIDACPDLKGDKEHKGCPDSDGDGVYDNEDNCPTEFGPKENKGCPWGDSDGDGILDKDDLCPNEKGLPQYRGCPAPKHKSFASQIPPILDDSILFESGKTEISAANLKRIKNFGSRMMNESKSYDVLLIGHTDNAEADSSKLDKLALDRAEAIRQILIAQGIEEKRITIEEYGAAQPAGDNTNPVTRRFNRRVQLFIEVVGEEK